MRCRPQNEAVEVLPVRNGGDVPINVSLSVSNSDYFSVSPQYISLKAGQQGSYRLTFNSRRITDYSSCQQW